MQNYSIIQQRLKGSCPQFEVELLFSHCKEKTLKIIYRTYSYLGIGEQYTLIDFSNKANKREITKAAKEICNHLLISSKTETIEQLISNMTLSYPQ